MFVCGPLSGLSHLIVYNYIYCLLSVFGPSGLWLTVARQWQLPVIMLWVFWGITRSTNIEVHPRTQDGGHRNSGNLSNINSRMKMSERASEWVSERASEWVSECEWVSEWVSEPASQRARVIPLVKQRVDTEWAISHFLNEWLHKWSDVYICGRFADRHISLP